MDNLVFKGNEGQALTNSLLIAEKFGKYHKHVIQSIKDLITSAEKSANLFIESEYPDSYGRPQPMYAMNRDGFTLLVMGFTGDKALQFKLDYIEAFNRMEKSIASNGFQIPASFSEALMLAAKQAEQIENQQKQLQSQAPKVLFADAVATSKRSCLVAELAKILQQNGVNIGQNRLFAWMREKGYLCRKGQYYNQPTQKAMGMGLFEIKKTSIARSDGSITVNTTTKVTGKGQVYFVDRFLGDKIAS